MSKRATLKLDTYKPINYQGTYKRSALLMLLNYSN